MKLGRQAFPALLVFGVEPDVLYPRIRCCNADAKCTPPCTGHRWSLVEANVVLTEIPSWRSLENGGCIASAESLLTEEEKLMLSIDLREANGLIETRYSDNTIVQNLLPTLQSRETILKAHAFGGKSHFPPLSPNATVPESPDLHPKPKWPTIGENLPSRLAWAGPATPLEFVILGEDLKFVDLDGIKEVSNKAQILDRRRVGGSIVLKLTVPAPATLSFELPVPPKSSNLPETLTLQSRPLPVGGSPEDCPPDCPPIAVVRTRETKAAATGSVERTVEFGRGVTDPHLNLAREILRDANTEHSPTNAASRTIEVNVEANDNHDRP